MTEPITDNVEDPSVGVAQASINALVDNARSLGLTWSVRPGTVATDSPLTTSEVRVILDGDSTELTMVSLVGPLLDGVRVMTVSVPPSGLFIIGSPAHDYWHAVGDEGEPDFATGWSNFGAPGGGVGFRRTLDGHLELTGLADFSSTAAAPTIIFTLPEGWRPDRQVSFITSNNPGTAIAPTPRSLQILTTGEVQVTNYVGTIDPGLVYLDGIYVALRTGI